MADADIAGNGALWVGLEATYGTPEDPTDTGTGVWVPIISETLAYTETKYFSPQIRASAVVSDVEQSYYHVAGDIVMEVDSNFMPYFLAASRHKTTQGAAVGGIIPYTFEPTGIGSTYPGSTNANGLSIAVVRNGVGFLYSGCVVGQYAFTIDNGVLRVTCSMLGLAEKATSNNSFASLYSWTDPDLFGASAHAVYVDAAGTTPAFASADKSFNGFTFTANYNAAAQNRLTPDRGATYISYGEIEATYDTELDFTSRTEYDNMVDNTLRAIKFESKKGTAPVTWANADAGFRITAYNTAYNTYTVGLSGIGDLLMAAVNGRCMGIAGGLPYKFEMKSKADLGLGA